MEVLNAGFRAGVLVITFSVDELVDDATVKQAGSQLLELASTAKNKKILLNLRGISLMSSPMLGQLTVLYKKCKADEITLILSNLGPSLKKVFKLLRLDQVFETYDNEAEAMSAFKRQTFASEETIGQDQIFRFQIAAAQGNPEAQYLLARCYDEGNGVSRNLEAAMDWYRKSAEQNHAPAQYILGMSYAYGIHFAPSLTKAIAWYRKAADQGHVQAQYTLAKVASHGLGVPQDDSAADEWVRKAAELGDNDAQHHVANSIPDGSDVVPDPEEALKWYRRAAEKGHSNAQACLGWFYWNGAGVPQDSSESMKWYRKAAEQGNAQAREALEQIERELRADACE